MAQLDGIGMPRISTSSAKSPTTPSARTSLDSEQLFHGDASSWPSGSSPLLRNYHGHEESHTPNSKKSVLAKVKEKAKKMRHSLSKKKHWHEDNDSGSPSQGVALGNDKDDEDPEYLGAPMYESELAPEIYKEAARQHPRAIPLVSEKHVLPSSVKHEVEQEKEKPHSPNKTVTETVSEKLGPAYTAVSDTNAGKTVATNAVTSTFAAKTVATPTAPDTAEYAGSGSETKEHMRSGQQSWDKGVSVKEYLMHKLEPGEDERALSQAITEAMSPRRTPGDMGVVEKVREAVNSLLRNEEHSRSTTRATNLSKTSSSSIPISTNAQEVVEEENHGRILQTN